MGVGGEAAGRRVGKGDNGLREKVERRGVEEGTKLKDKREEEREKRRKDERTLNSLSPNVTTSLA